MGFAWNPVSVKAAGWSEDIGKRSEMEDGWIFVDQFGGKPRGAFFAVYDGHGGRQVVDFVQSELHLCVLRELRTTSSVPQALRSAFEAIDDEMVRRSMMTSGCTACVCILAQEDAHRMVYTAHLGDSRAVMCRNGIAVRLTSMTDHKATDPLEAKRVIEAGGRIVNDRVNGMLAMTRALGDHLLKMPILPNSVVSNVPDVTSTSLSGKDAFIILACDGLWDVIDDQGAVELVEASMQELASVALQLEAENRSWAEVLARVLVEEALARGSCDNVTCLVILL